MKKFIEEPIPLTTELKSGAEKTDNNKVEKAGRRVVVFSGEDDKILFLRPDEVAKFVAKQKENKFKVGIRENGDLIIKPKQPEAVLKDAEKCFNEENFESAHFKLGFISEEDRNKRLEELLNGSDEERELAEKMYLAEEWRNEIRADTWESKLTKK
ncbi:MAG: hypothetical protein KAU07_00390 [Candidatus Andersenbacteria bacterium]|nr:hypothetical protein [Candidatus Andersenbacteria bacterium]